MPTKIEIVQDCVLTKLQCHLAYLPRERARNLIAPGWPGRQVSIKRQGPLFKRGARRGKQILSNRQRFKNNRGLHADLALIKVCPQIFFALCHPSNLSLHISLFLLPPPPLPDVSTSGDRELSRRPHAVAIVEDRKTPTWQRLISSRNVCWPS
jgi:hypothetical protein